MRVWTKQHQAVLRNIEQTGRHIAQAEYIRRENEEHADLWLEIYSWYTRNAAAIKPKPTDVQYPIWVALANDAQMILSPETVILELEVDESLILPVDIEKWGNIANFFYLPADAADARRHSRLLEEYGTNDATAYMTAFYPQIKREIIESWPRLFEPLALSATRTGTIWEIQQSQLIGTVDPTDV